ncbi:MAG: ester cyclase [Chloroflexi bacterium]|nr:ester cyclase [Chloroflexota bacterium]MBI2983363.1 ester cyclase [Chloroflexota bacterium]
MDPKAIVRRCFEDVIVRGDIEVADEVVDHDLVFQTATGAVLRGRREFQHFAEQLREAFPDIKFEIEEEFADGEHVCTRYTMSGTFLSTLMGLLPNGERFSVRGIDTFRVVDGKVVEIHASYDMLGQMQQLGIVPKI